MPKIPTDPYSLPTEFEPLDEGLAYDVAIRECSVDGPDKNGDHYLVCAYTVLGPPEWEGRRLFDNYIGIPKEVLAHMSNNERRAIQERGIKYARWARCFKLGGPEGIDTDEAPGREGKVTVRNEEYQGQMRSRVHEYLF